MQFRGYLVDSVHRTVTSPDGRMVRLEPKAFDLLAYFAAHPEEMLSRERLIADVWNGKFVTDDAVMVAVYALRQAFDDDSRKPHFIETIRGRGYRWIATPDADVVVPPVPEKRGRSFVAAWAALIAVARRRDAVLPPGHADQRRPRQAIARYDRAFAESGLPGVSAAWLEQFKANPTIPRFMAAFFAARAGHDSEAIELLRESLRRREPGTLWLGVHPAFASMRDQREFGALAASSFHTR